MPQDPQTPKPSLSLVQKFTYNSGVFLDQAGLHAVNYLALPVYNVLLGLNPALIGYALAIFRLWDALIDPLMGYMSDRFSSRWGRRKPFMLVGALACGIVFPAVWWASPSWTEPTILTYFVILNLIYFTALTAYSIPFQALGCELTRDANDRSSLYAIRGWAAITGMLGINWIFPLSQLDFFSSPLQGIKFVTTAVGCFFVMTALLPITFLRERPVLPTEKSKRSSPRLIGTKGFFSSVKEVLRDKVYLRVVTLSCLMVVGSNVVGSLSFYINVYYVYSGDVKAGSWITGAVATIATIFCLMALPFLPYLHRRFGKAKTVIGCLVLQLLGSLLKLSCYTPNYPWLQLVPAVLLAVGTACYWTQAPSMVADICDLDDFRNGRRQEGLYASVTQWVNKVGYSIANVLSGLVLVWVGFQVTLGGEQSEGTLLWMRLIFALVPAVTIIAGIFVFWNYPLSSERMAEIQRELNSRQDGRAKTEGSS